MIDKKISLILKQIRVNLPKMTQEEFAKKLDIKIEELIKSDKNAGYLPDSIMEILKSLGVSVDWFIFDENEEIKAWRKYLNPTIEFMRESILIDIAKIIKKISDLNLLMWNYDIDRKIVTTSSEIKERKKIKKDGRAWTKYRRAAVMINNGKKKKKVAKKLNVTPSTISQWIKRGKLNPYLKK